MPANRNALIRYRTIDKCLQNRYRKWTLEDLIEQVSDTLYDYEGIEKGVSKRTIQMDIQMMRSDKLGYNAPIIVVDKKYYTYEDPEYSITNIPLTDQDLNQLSETVDFLKQFRGFSHFKELEEMVQKLEDQIYAQKTRRKPVIDFEKNENLKGLQFLDPLYKSIINKQVILLTYQSFKARDSTEFRFHPYLLKEFKNRWFIIGTKRQREGIMNLALDRIINIQYTEDYFHIPDEFDPESYFANVIGVSVSPGLDTERILLYVVNKHAPYVQTKPLHHSQKIIEKDNYGITISLDVQHNFELEKEILGFGDGIKVIAPQRLKKNIKLRLAGGLELYNTEISEQGLKAAQKRIKHGGFAILNHVYSQREIRRIKKALDQKISDLDQDQSLLTKRGNLFNLMPGLKDMILNNNLKNILNSIGANLFLTDSTYLNKTHNSEKHVKWHQNSTINVDKKLSKSGYSKWDKVDDQILVEPPADINENRFVIRIHLDDIDQRSGALKLIPGSHQKVLTNEQIQLVTNNSIENICEVYSGGILIMKPLILQAYVRSNHQKQKRVVHLELSAMELHDELQWAMRMTI